MTGLSTSTSISFGSTFVAGRNRVPRPAAGKTAFRIVRSMRVIVSQVQSAACSILRFLRDNLEVVRNGLQKRGADLASELEDLATLETRRRRLLPEIEGLKREQNTAGDEVARAKRQGLDASKIQEASRARAQQIKQLSVELDTVEQRRNRGLLTIPNLPHESVPVGKSSADNVEVRRHGTPRDLRVHSAGALGSRSRAGHHRLRARHQDRRRAVLRADRRGGASRAGADQLHAQPAHERARVHGSGAAVPREPAHR